MAKVAVTGGVGFIDSNLTCRLVSEGYDAVVVDDLSTGPLSNIDQERTEFHQISITDPKALSAAHKACQTIFHLVRKGLTQRTAAIVLLAVSALFALLAIGIYKSPTSLGTPLTCLTAAIWANALIYFLRIPSEDGLKQQSQTVAIPNHRLLAFLPVD